MAEDTNPMQAQLGLVGQSGSFSPTGIATPPPVAAIVKHPGEIAQDIVRQTQTAMATTMQTTAASRLGVLGGTAFNGTTSGIGAIGAFAQQYQQNMGAINAMQFNPYMAQMYGNMGGMSGGFMPGMMPHPSMLTSPGMGIYRTGFQTPMPSISPFPQMPILPTPFTPTPPPALYQTPTEHAMNMAIQAGQRRTAAVFAAPGVMARAATDIGLGYMGASAGAALGARMGPTGALIGMGVGGLLGAFGSERLGLGATAQHMVDGINPFRSMAIRSQQMLGSSQDWVSGGPDLNMITGRGLSTHGATRLARRLEDTAYSGQFQRETAGMFSAQDLTRITRISGQQGMLNDVQSVDDIHGRVRSIAKNLVNFMKIANEPSVTEAIRAMGQMRTMGLSVPETMAAAVEARSYARMAGTTTRGIMETGGMQGAMIFQQQGLSAGLGLRMGMGALGTANAAVAAGAFTPQRLAMLGGVQGVAQHELESNAALLKMPVIAAAMSRMGPGGEFRVDGAGIRAMRDGRMNIGDLASRGANNLIDAVSKQGVGALGLMQVQGTELQDQIGRLLGPEGMQLMKVKQVTNTMKMLGLQRNAGGFATAGLAMGMEADQVKALMSEVSSPAYFRNKISQIHVQEMESRALEAQEMERSRPGFTKRLMRATMGEGTGRLANMAADFRDVGEQGINVYTDLATDMQAAGRGQVVLRTNKNLIASDSNIKTWNSLSEAERKAAMQTNVAYASAYGGTASGMFSRAAGGEFGDISQLRQAQGGFASIFGGGAMELGVRGLFGLMGASAGRPSVVNDMVFGTQAELQAKNESYGAVGDIMQRGTGLGKDEKAALLNEVAASTGVDKETLKKISLKAAGRVAALARSKAKVSGKNERLDNETYTNAMREAATEFGVNLSDADLKKLGARERDVVAGLSTINPEATSGYDTLNVKSDKEFKAAIEAKQKNLMESAIGEGNLGEQINMTERLFENETSPEAALLASLAAAAERGVPGAQEAYEKAYLNASEENQEASHLIKKKFTGDLEKANLARLGAKTLTTDENRRLGVMTGFRNKYTQTRVAALTGSGQRTLFGATSSSIKELLTGPEDKMSARGLKLKKDYEAATKAGDTAKMREVMQQAESEVQLVGQNSEEFLAGGYGGKAKIEGEAKKGVTAETASAVTGLFSSAEMAQAARDLRAAAQGLNKFTGYKPDVPKTVTSRQE